jgi:predicted TIM-barrel fold metal-dependent hydrolase
MREAVAVFDSDRVMFGTDYEPVPLDLKEHVDIVNTLEISPADKEKILWRNAAAFFQSESCGVSDQRITCKAGPVLTLSYRTTM